VKFVLDCAKLLAYCALILLLGEAAWTLHRLRPKLEVTVSNIDRATIAAGAAAGNVEKASRAWEKSSMEQSSKTTAAMSAVSVSAERLSTFVSRTDASVNSDLLPALTLSIRQQNASLLQSQEGLQDNLKEMLKATQSLRKDLDDADRTISGPELKETLQNTADASKNAVVVTQNLAATTADVREGVHYEVRQLEAPVTKVRAVFGIALTVLRKLFF
jgi:hypothetical protein